MGELVAEETDAVYHRAELRRRFRRAVQFVVHAVAHDAFSVESLAEAYRSGFRVNAVGGVSGDALRISGIDDINEVHVAVSVAVVLREIQFAVNGGTGVGEQSLHVLLRRISLAVGFQGLVEFHRTVHVKLRGEFPETHVGEIASHAAVVAHEAPLCGEISHFGVVGLVEQILSVEVFVESLLGVRHGERHVAELHQYHRYLLFAEVRHQRYVLRHRFAHHAAGLGLYVCAFKEKSLVLRAHRFLFGFAPCPCLVGEKLCWLQRAVLADAGNEEIRALLIEQRAVVCQEIAKVLVAHCPYCQRRAVALFHHCPARLHLHRPGGHGREQQICK